MLQQPRPFSREDTLFGDRLPLSSNNQTWGAVHPVNKSAASKAPQCICEAVSLRLVQGLVPALQLGPVMSSAVNAPPKITNLILSRAQHCEPHTFRRPPKNVSPSRKFHVAAQV